MGILLVKKEVLDNRQLIIIIQKNLERRRRKNNQVQATKKMKMKMIKNKTNYKLKSSQISTRSKKLK